MNWTTVWQLAGEICDLLFAEGIVTTAHKQEQIASLLFDRQGMTFISHTQEWRRAPADAQQVSD